MPVIRVVARRERRGAGTLPPIADLAQAREDVRSSSSNSSWRHLAELDPHLRREQLLAQRRVVVQLGVDRRGDLVEDEPQTADQQRVENEHASIDRRCRQCARSSFSRMLTKLYGGHGPVYLKVSLS